MDKEFRSYLTTSYSKSQDYNPYHKTPTGPGVLKPPHFTSGDTLEFSAHTSLLQALYSLDLCVKTITEFEYPPTSLLEKIKVKLR